MPDPRHAARGGLDPVLLRELVALGLTQREIAEAVDRSQGTVRWWLQRHGLATRGRRGRTPRVLPGGACPKHGEGTLVQDRRGPCCRRCRAEAVSARRRRVKAQLVAEAGGACSLCGYDHSVAALQFHHRDPASKHFGIGSRGLTQGIDALRAEAAKCVLLCANCHAEVEAGVSELPFSPP